MTDTEEFRKVPRRDKKCGKCGKMSKTFPTTWTAVSEPAQKPIVASVIDLKDLENQFQALAAVPKVSEKQKKLKNVVLPKTSEI